MKITDATKTTVQELWSQVEDRLHWVDCLEEAAQAIVEALYRSFEESLVLGRVFVTVPFSALPAANREAVQELVRVRAAGEELRPGTPILSLIGTRGENPDWNDRRNSRDHVGIPLISSAFVESIPMISRLLKELGVPLTWADSPQAEAVVRSMSGCVGLFFVEDAATATNSSGQPIITARDFVERYQVRTVFGTGGVYATGQIFAIILFCRHNVPRQVAEHFLLLSVSFNHATSPLAGQAKIFR